jgi:hypothetical protein
MIRRDFFRTAMIVEGWICSVQYVHSEAAAMSQAYIPSRRRFYLVPHRFVLSFSECYWAVKLESRDAIMQINETHQKNHHTYCCKVHQQGGRSCLLGQVARPWTL